MAALQPSALDPTAPTLSLTDFSRAPQDFATDDLEFDLPEERSIIYLVAHVKRCALRPAFGLAFFPRAPPDPPKQARRARPATPDFYMLQPLADWLHRSRAQDDFPRQLYDNLQGGHALRDRRHAVQVFATTSAPPANAPAAFCGACAYAPVVYLGPGCAGRAPEQRHHTGTPE